MSKRWRTGLIIAAVLLGVAVALWRWWYVPPPPEVKHTDAIIEEMRHENDVLRQRLKERDAELRKRVVTVRAEVNSQVKSLASDAVAGSLNDELAVWRGVEVRPGGMDGP